MIELEVENYFAFINGNILSVVPFSGGNDTTSIGTYNIDLKTLSKIDNKELLPEDIDLKEIKTKFKTYAKKLSDEALAKISANTNSDWMPARSEEKLKEFEDLLEKDFEKIYLNENGDVIISVEHWVLGGQETCQKILQINVTQNGEVTELDYKDYLGKDLRPTVNYEVDVNDKNVLNSDSIDLSKYMDMDIKEAAEELKFKKGTGSGPDFYTYEYSTEIRLETLATSPSNVSRITIGSKTSNYNIYGVGYGMTFEEAKEALEKIGIEKINHSLYVYTFYLKNGTNLVINLRGDFYDIITNFTLNKTQSTNY